MLAALLSLAVVVVEEEEPSKVPFYVLGGLAACWAILLFAVGMRSPNFPGSASAERGVITVSIVLVVATMASAVLTA
jgi:hypothetical protein